MLAELTIKLNEYKNLDFKTAFEYLTNVCNDMGIVDLISTSLADQMPALLSRFQAPAKSSGRSANIGSTGKYVDAKREQVFNI